MSHLESIQFAYAILSDDDITERSRIEVARRLLRTAMGMGRPAQRADVRHTDAITLDVPHGYDTVLGYLAKYHPDVLDDVNYSDPTVTLRDGLWCMHRSRELGLASVDVDAPPCLKTAGIGTVKAWPITLLAKRWG